MNRELEVVLEDIGREFQDRIDTRSRHYLEVNIGQRAGRMGYADLVERFRGASVVVPLKGPVPGMKVMIDGRTFVDYERFDSGIAAPGYVARQTALGRKPYVADESMILNFA